VDVYVESVADPMDSFVMPGVAYGAVSPYHQSTPGSYVISMRAAGAPADSPSVIASTVDVMPGGAYTVAGVGMSASLMLSVLHDRIDMPEAGRAGVRVINAATSLPMMDYGPAGEEPWARDVGFGAATGYREVPLGTSNLEVTAAGRMATALGVTLDMNSVYTVLLIERDGALSAELYLDSVGSASVPVGGVEAGFGGMAQPSSGSTVGVLLVAAGLGGLLTALVVRARRPAVPRAR